jgi:hypothetical protein
MIRVRKRNTLVSPKARKGIAMVHLVVLPGRQTLGCLCMNLYLELMDFAQFRKSLTNTDPPDGGEILMALWYDARGEWQKAHEIVQDLETREAAWIHAYLHRKEGDLSNAQYWYHRAGQSLPQGSFEQEWEMIARRFTG